MQQKESKEKYRSPEVAFSELTTGSLVCTSGGEYPEWPEENI